MKVSFIMQSYLGDYPNARSNPRFKFLRAVQSVIDQNNKNSELIIISDGCEITHDLYFKHYKSNDRVKYAFVDKDAPKMYENNKGSQYYRGFPRQIGIEMATGDIIAYIDSDDFIIKNTVDVILHMWNQPGDFNAILTNTWYVNSIVKSIKSDKNLKFKKENIVIENLPDSTEWCVCLPANENVILKSTSSICHLKNINIKWEDVLVESGESSSEDNVFVSKIIKQKNFVINNKNPYYVVCHQHGVWDI